MTFRPDPKPSPKIKVKKKYEYKRKPTGEKQVFEEIANSGNMRSFISDVPIPEPTASNFLHVLPKAQNKYPLFKTYKKNIVPGTEDEHDKWDNGSREELKKDPKWKKMFDLEAELLDEYKALEEQNKIT